MNRRIEFMLLVLLVFVYFFWFGWLLIWSASANARLVSVFSLDEFTHLQLVKEAIDQKTLFIHFTHYGHLQFNLVLIPFFLFSYIRPVTEQYIIVALRLVTLIFAAATVTITFLLARRYFGSLTAWLAAIVLSTVPLNFLNWSVISHPDTLQLFFLILTLYFCCRMVEEVGWRWFFWATVTAGLAFASKYSGLFLLPIIWSIAIIQIIMGIDKSQSQINLDRFLKGIRYTLIPLGLFALVGSFVVTPEVVGHYLVRDGRMDEPWRVAAIHSLQTEALVFGCSLIMLAIPKFVWDYFEQKPKISYILYKIIISTLVFGVTFFIVSPGSFERLSFLQGLVRETRFTAFGGALGSNQSGLNWFSILISPELLGPFIAGLALMSLIVVIYQVFKQGWPHLLRPEIILWVWVIFYLSMLVLRVRLFYPHYLLPVIPLLFILAMQPIGQLASYITNKLSLKSAVSVTIACLLMTLGLELPTGIDRILEYRRTSLIREQTSLSVQVGTWLTKQYPVSARILYDWYSYVPPVFTNAEPIPWGGGTLATLSSFKPKIVIVHQSISDLFSDTSQAGNFFGGAESFNDRYKYYHGLRSGQLNYRLVHDFGSIQVYEKE